MANTAKGAGMPQPLLRDIPRKHEVRIYVEEGLEYAWAFFYAFNTSIAIKVHIGDRATGAQSECMLDGIVSFCRASERNLSRTLEESDVVRINESSGQMVEVSQQTWNVIVLGMQYSQKSGGCFDITMGSVTRLWDFNQQIVADPDELAEAVQHVNWRGIDPICAGEKYFIRLKDPAACIDLGGMAKGYLADCIRSQLMDAGMAGAFINLGGNVAVFGKKAGGAPWNIGLRSPFGNDILGTVAMSWGSAVTSGPYERCFERDGRSYHHMLDCRTGTPIDTDLLSATVIAGHSKDADGLSTTLFALGHDQALDFMTRQNGLDAVLVKRDGTVSTTEGAGFVAL